MRVLVISIAGEKYGYGNYSRQRLICGSLLEKGCSLEHYVIADQDFLPEKSYEKEATINFLAIDYLLGVLKEKKIEIVVFDLFGFWCAHAPLYLPNIYKNITEKNKTAMVVGFDDIRYADALFDIQNFTSFISNGPTDEQAYISTSRIFVGLQYHVFNPLVFELRKNLPTPKKGIVVAISGSDINNVTEVICAALAKIKLANSVTVFVGHGISARRKKDIKKLCLQFGFLCQYFSDLFYKALSNAEYLICGEGTIKFDGLALEAKTMVFTQLENESLPLNNFFLAEGAHLLGSMNDTSLDDLVKRMTVVMSNNEKHFDFPLKGTATNLIAELLLTQRRHIHEK